MSTVVDDTNAPTLAGLLYLGAAVGVLPMVRRRAEPARWPAARRRLGLAVVAGGLVGPLLLTAGLARVPAATASLLLNLELAATVALAALFFGEHLGRRIRLGTVVVLVAGVIAAWSESPELRWGAVLIAGACVCWGLDNCVTAGLDAIAPERITLAKGVVAGSVNLILGLALGGSLPGASGTLLAMVAGGLGYGLSITLWVAGARDIGAARGQLVFATAPFVGVLVAWVAFGDDVRGPEVVAVLLALAGVGLVLRSDHVHGHRHQALEHSHEHGHDDDHHAHEHGPATPPRHVHAHRHEPLVHAHPHVPDLHHRHEHA